MPYRRRSQTGSPCHNELALRFFQGEATVKTYYAGFCALLLIAATAAAKDVPANDAPASDASIREMLELTNARQLVDGMKGQIAAMSSNLTHDALKGQDVTPERQAILDRAQAKISAVSSDLLNWDTLLPVYLRTYRASFTQGEIDGVIKFYKSPAGQAYVKKMPLVMQNVMQEVQGLIKPMQEKMVAIQKETTQELKALNDKDRKPN
jgi:uncharacterized protein